MQRQNADAQRFQADYFVPLLLWLGALLAIRIAALVAARIDLVLDEAQYWTWSRELAFGYFSKPPMIAWLIRGATEICGNGEACVRAASPVLYTVTSILIYAAARQLYSERIAFWSAIVFATLPGVSYSSMLITTDVPLVLFWSLALYAWIMLVKGGEMRFAILLGVAVGLGLLSKQAMIYFVLCAACHAIFSRDAREALKGGRAIVAAAIALAFAAPMLVWNAQHDFVTFQHTATNIGWKFPYVHPLALLDYVVVQFGVFGPILMAVYLRTAFRAFPREAERRQDSLARLLASRSGAASYSVAALTRPWQLDRGCLSGGHDPCDRGDVRARALASVPHLARAPSRRRGLDRDGSGLRAATSQLRAPAISAPESWAGAASPTRCGRNSPRITMARSWSTRARWRPSCCIISATTRRRFMFGCTSPSRRTNTS